MKMLKQYICLSLIFLLMSAAVSAQQMITVKGRVLGGNKKQPIANAQIFSPDGKATVMTNPDGTFVLEVSDPRTVLNVKAEHYYEHTACLLGRKELKIYLIPRNTMMYTDRYEGSEGPLKMDYKPGTARTIHHKDMSDALSGVDDALAGKLAGVRVVNKGGMPGEGSLVNMRGIRSFVADNTPLVVVDGLPYLPDLEVSSVISGFSRSMFAPVNLKDIESVTLLRGADATAYGSLGSNGVLLINTQKASDLETQIEFQTVEGVGFVRKKMPLMQSEAFKNYIADIGETKYADLNEMIDIFPFLKDDPDDHYGYLYDNNTNWQKEIYTPAFSSENILKIKGGDAVAVYAISAGLQYNKGIVENTDQQKYFTHLNTKINITKKLSTFLNVGFNYGVHNAMEQGMVKETNPILAALQKAPVLSVYEQDQHKNNLPNFNPVQQFGISNPAAIVADVNAKNRAYDVLVSLGLDYDINAFWKFHVLGGLYYNYNQEKTFIPGKSSGAIAPLMHGFAQNTVRGGIGEALNYYVKASFGYDRTLNEVHEVSAAAGFQLMSSRRELDYGTGVNTSSDFYQELGNATKFRTITGYIDQWRWMDAYLKASYGFNHQYYITAAAAVDMSSAYGENSARAFVMPSAQIAWKMKNASFLRDNDFIGDLTLRGEYGFNGNSRYSSKYGRYYYVSRNFYDLSGLVRAGLPNLQIKPEKNITANVGVDLGLFAKRAFLSVDFYEERTKDMILDRKMPAAYAYRTMYDNAGEIRTRGLEASLNVNLLEKGGFSWIIGGNIAAYKSKVMELGGAKTRTVTFSDGTQLRTEVGKAPNLFYGYRMDGVYASKQQAVAADMYSHGGLQFAAGDAIFRNLNGDHVIDDRDMMVIGDPAPDFYGGFYTRLNYKGLSLFANFTYSYGNDVYNAVRRSTESMSGFENQSRIAERRWTSDGQVTDIPRAVYGDPIENSRFSDRWIEDGSYLRLKELTLSYETNRKLLVFNKLRVYVTGENLFTCTKYLGLDPEFSYSYSPEYAGLDLGKIPVSRNVKVGLVLNF